MRACWVVTAELVRRCQYYLEKNMMGAAQVYFQTAERIFDMSMEAVGKDPVLASAALHIQMGLRGLSARLQDKFQEGR